MRIDWSTLALQTVNVLVLVGLLQRFLFRPVAAIIAARRAAAEKMLSDAATAGAGLEARAAELARREKDAEAEADRIREAAHEAARSERDALLRQAQENIARARARAEQETSTAREAMRQDLEREAGQLAASIAARLLQRLPAEPTASAFLPALRSALDGLSEEERAGLSDPDAPLAVVSAAALPPQCRNELASLLSATLGHAPALSWQEDPSLIAGIELHGPRCVVRNSLRADLDGIAAELHEEAERPLREEVPA
jgi:F-type H+-transporting ATPase subunit b